MLAYAGVMIAASLVIVSPAIEMAEEAGKIAWVPAA